VPNSPIAVAHRSTRPCLALGVVAVAFLVGCGPFGYLTKVSRDASRAVADAEAAGAAEYAPYEYWGAVTYLDEARNLMGYSEYERSFDYGTRARQLGEEAKRKADMRESGKMVQSLESVPENGTPAADPPPPAKADPSDPSPRDEGDP